MSIFKDKLPLPTNGENSIKAIVKTIVRIEMNTSKL